MDKHTTFFTFALALALSLAPISTSTAWAEAPDKALTSEAIERVVEWSIAPKALDQVDRLAAKKGVNLGSDRGGEKMEAARAADERGSKGWSNEIDSGPPKTQGPPWVFGISRETESRRSVAPLG